jgi:predicted lipoprotein with Yx(FWY)xxD motif
MTAITRYSALIAVVAGGALALSACGGSGGSSVSPAGGGDASSPATVSTADVAGVGTVLVDSSGAALYFPEQEADGTVLCTGSCTSIWLPLTVGSTESTPSGSGDVSGQLGVLQRPDGAAQVTFDGKPLYRFVEDSGPGAVSGNGVSDSFDGKDFTWHVASLGPVTTGGTSGGGRGY